MSFVELKIAINGDDPQEIAVLEGALSALRTIRGGEPTQLPVTELPPPPEKTEPEVDPKIEARTKERIKQLEGLGFVFDESGSMADGERNTPLEDIRTYSTRKWNAMIKKIEASQTEEPTPEPEQAPKEESAHAQQQEEKQVTRDDLRALLAKKVGDHRPAIVKRLKAFDADSITTLDAQHFATFHNFLNEL